MRNGLTVEIMAHKCVTCGVSQFTSLLMLVCHDHKQVDIMVSCINYVCNWKTIELLDVTSVV